MPVPSASIHTLPLRREWQMDEKQEQPKGNIVQTIKFGGATVNIRDDCFVKTPEEKERVLAELYSVGWAIAKRLRREGIEV